MPRAGLLECLSVVGWAAASADSGGTVPQPESSKLSSQSGEGLVIVGPWPQEWTEPPAMLRSRHCLVPCVCSERGGRARVDAGGGVTQRLCPGERGVGGQGGCHGAG